MKFKLFNATSMHNSTEKWKKSDLNKKKSDFFDFFIKNHYFFQPWHLPLIHSIVATNDTYMLHDLHSAHTGQAY